MKRDQFLSTSSVLFNIEIKVNRMNASAFVSDEIVQKRERELIVNKKKQKNKKKQIHRAPSKTPLPIKKRRPKTKDQKNGGEKKRKRNYSFSSPRQSINHKPVLRTGTWSKHQALLKV